MEKPRTAGLGATGHSVESWFPDVSHDRDTLHQQLPKDLPLLCKTLPLSLGFYIEKALCCTYLALLPEHDSTYQNLETDAVMLRECEQGLWRYLLAFPEPLPLFFMKLEVPVKPTKIQSTSISSVEGKEAEAEDQI